MLVEYSSSHFQRPPPPSRHRNPLIERLKSFVSLGVAEIDAIETMCSNRRILQAHEMLVCEGVRPDRVYLMISGLAFRYRFLSNGRRQIFGYLLPGDLCDTQFVILNEADHNVGLLCDSEVAVISLSVMMRTMVAFPKIERALLMMSLVDAAMLREWLLNVGQRDAFQKLAHFFCELNARYGSLGIHEEASGFSIPLTQIDLADTMGLTVVHVNRMLQRFRHEGLLNWSRRHVEILDYPKLEYLAGFDASYLRLGEKRVEPQLCAYG